VTKRGARVSMGYDRFNCNKGAGTRYHTIIRLLVWEVQVLSIVPSVTHDFANCLYMMRLSGPYLSVRIQLYMMIYQSLGGGLLEPLPPPGRFFPTALPGLGEVRRRFSSALQCQMPLRPHLRTPSAPITNKQTPHNHIPDC
jgi:hypothetical protein